MSKINSCLRSTILRFCPEYILEYYRYCRYTFCDNGTLVLNSIPKSGTNWFRLLFTNYLYVFYKKWNTPITYSEIHESIFPNIRDAIMFKRKKYKIPKEDNAIRFTEYKDFIYGHYCTGLKMSEAKKIIHLYRNPLDVIISRFYYSWKNRPERQNMVNHPRDVIDHVLDKYILHYNYMKKIHSGKVLRISYESLYKNTFSTFYTILDWLNITIDIDSITKAVDFSDKKNIKDEELKIGKAIHSSESYLGSFVRSGEIGQWKKYFNKTDINHIEQKLNDSKIKLNEFIIE